MYFVNRSLIASNIFYLESGKLIFDPSHKVRLTADDVLIMHNGSLIIGNPECEYKGDVEIVFTGGDEDPDVSFGHYTKVAQGKVTFEICNYCSFEWNKTKFNSSRGCMWMLEVILISMEQISCPGLSWPLLLNLWRTQMSIYYSW